MIAVGYFIPRILPEDVRVQFTHAIEEIRQEAARLMVYEVRRTMREDPKTGVFYGSHQASAPGETPAWWSSELGGSFQANTEEPGSVTSDSLYASWLEFGNESSHLLPRPFIAVSAEKVAADYFHELEGLYESITGEILFQTNIPVSDLRSRFAARAHTRVKARRAAGGTDKSYSKQWGAEIADLWASYRREGGYWE